MIPGIDPTAQNGEVLDADALPGPLDVPEMRRAMGVLKMLAQNDMERELYEGRLKAKRDLQTLETLRDQWQRRYMEAEHQLDTVTQERDAVTRERDVARREINHKLAERIRLCQRLLKRPVTEIEELASSDLGSLQDLADHLEQELTG